MTTKNQMLKYVRLNCSECMGAGRATELTLPVSNPGDIEGCTAPKCIWFPFRFGIDPAKNPDKVRQGKERVAASVKERSRKINVEREGLEST
jgi:hypothetical protein